MTKFIIQLVMMLSLGSILYIIARALPRISDDDLKNKKTNHPHWFISYLEKADEWLKAFSEKFLRRARVWILKLDNFVARKLSMFKKETPKETVLPMENKTEAVTSENSNLESPDKTI